MALADLDQGAILFSGDPEIFDRWQSHAANSSVESVPPSRLIATLAQRATDTAAVVLTLWQSGSPRLAEATSELSAETLKLLSEIQRICPGLPVILLTPSAVPLDVCCSAVRLGASSFVDLDSPGCFERLDATLVNLTHSIHARAVRRADPKVLLDAVGIMAISQPMQDLIMQVYRAAQVSDATVLIHGESGSGKQLLAEAVHRLDLKRNKAAFVSVNCAAITGTLAESELFGHTRGAFTGATDARQGYFRAAQRGTIFLDEISELPLHLQPKLLRVLQERRVMPVGADKEEPIDVRVIAASNVSLQERVAAGTFRLDLYQRLNVIHLTVPPLRRRLEDIPLLLTHFVKKYQHYCLQEIRDVDPRVYELLKQRLGDGNVRELENVVRQTLVFKTAGDRIELSDLPRYLLESESAPAPKELIPTDVAAYLVGQIRDRRLTLRQAVDLFERALIAQAARSSPNMSKVELAKVLGLPRRTLYYKLDAE